MFMSPDDTNWTMWPPQILCYRGSTRGITGKFFWGGKVIFPDFFPGVKCFFPIENFHFGGPKTNFPGFWKVRSKKKKKVLSSFCNFSTFHFQFYTFPLQFSFFSSKFFPLFSFFPCLFFPSRSAEISQSEVSGGTLPPPPPVTPLGSTLESVNKLLQLLQLDKPFGNKTNTKGNYKKQYNISLTE